MSHRAGRWGTGVAILLAATLFCWATVTLGRAYAGGWVLALLGPVRAENSPALVETLFSLIVFAPLVAVALAAGAFERRNAAALGNRPTSHLLLGAALGVGGLGLAVGYAWMAGNLRAGSGAAFLPATLLWGAVVIGFQTSAEEIFFRGWLQPALVRRWSPALGVAAAALAFAVLHMAGGVRAPLSLLNLALGGLVFGLLAALGGGLAAAIGMHWGWNVSEQLGWGLDPNPGLGGFGALLDKELVGSAWWGGSGDGLNGSIGMTLALFAILLPLAALGWRRADAGVLSPTGAPG